MPRGRLRPSLRRRKGVPGLESDRAHCDTVPPGHAFWPLGFFPCARSVPIGAGSHGEWWCRPDLATIRAAPSAHV